MRAQLRGYLVLQIAFDHLPRRGFIRKQFIKPDLVAVAHVDVARCQHLGRARRLQCAFRGNGADKQVSVGDPASPFRLQASAGDQLGRPGPVIPDPVVLLDPVVDLLLELRIRQACHGRVVDADLIRQVQTPVFDPDLSFRQAAARNHDERGSQAAQLPDPANAFHSHPSMNLYFTTNRVFGQACACLRRPSGAFDRPFSPRYNERNSRLKACC